MPKWIESQIGYLKVDDKGSVIETHPYRYCAAGGKRFKVKVNPDGSESGVEEVENCCFIHVHPVTGEIMGSSGLSFYLDHELDGVCPTAMTGADGTVADVIKIHAAKKCSECGKVENLPLDQVLPPDFVQEVEVDGVKVNQHGYKWDKAGGKLVKKSGG